MDYNSIKVSELKDNEVGKRIKAFSKRFFYLSVFFLIVYVAMIFILVCTSLSNETVDENAAIVFLVSLGLGGYLCLLATYYVFIKSFGFGIIVQDINYIKTNINKSKVSEPIYCSVCGEEVSDNDKVCPHCGASFE